MQANRTILIAEDEPVMRVAIMDALELLEGFELIEAADGCEALRAIDRDKPEVVVLDVLMPKKDGIEVLMELRDRREERPALKIVVLSALVEPNLVDRLQRLGADRVLTKPFHVVDQVRVIRELTQTEE